MKYEFKKNGEDDYSLIYKNKEIKFNSDVDAASRLQECEATAKIKMIEDLSKKGISLRSLTIEVIKDGKKYYDNTNRIEMEKTYIDKEQALIFNELIKNKLGSGIEDLIRDIGLTEKKEVEDFSLDFAKIIAGQWKTPSGEILPKENKTE